jgi:hypothetical protein
MAQSSIITLESLVAITSMITAALAIWWALRRDKRESKAQKNDDIEKLMEVNDRIVKGLEKQNQLVEQQNEELKKSLDTERKRNERLEVRVDEIQKQYNALVLSITMGDICLNAKTCQNYNPGDRRERPSEK